MKLLVNLIAVVLISLCAAGCGGPSCKEIEQAEKDVITASNAVQIAVAARNKTNAQAERDKIAKAGEVLVKGEGKCTIDGVEKDYSKKTEKEKKELLDAALKKIDDAIKQL